MNRVLKRPMFRIGGSAGTGITSGLDQPQKMANGGRTGYMNGTNPYAMGSFQATGLPGFLTQFGLNLLSTPPQGNIFATAATAARDPFAALQASQVESMKTASDRKFARELAAEEREFEEGQLKKKLAAQKEIAGMDTTNIQDIAKERYGGDTIKAQRDVDFPTKVYPGLVDQYGKKQVATTVIDPFNVLQAQQTAALKTKADRDFARELAAEEREFEEGQLTRKLQSAEKIAGMDTTDETKRVQEIADEKYDSDIIKAQREVDFPTKVYPGLKEQYGDKQVATAVIDTSILSTPKKIDKFVDQNPFLASKVVYDVATDTAMRVVKDRLTGQFVLIPADSADIDTTGDDMPAPKSPRSFDYFNPEQKKKIEELGEEFSDDFYQGG